MNGGFAMVRTAQRCLGTTRRLIRQWWWKPSPIRLLVWVPIVDLATSRLNHSPGQKETFVQILAVIVAVIGIAAMVMSGLRLIAGEMFIGPFRAWMIRRDTGRKVYYVRGAFHERRRHARPQSTDVADSLQARLDQAQGKKDPTG